MMSELETVEFDHKKAINLLVQSYEKSLLSMKEEINKTVFKLRDNGQYFEKVLKDQEHEYESEVD